MTYDYNMTISMLMFFWHVTFHFFWGGTPWACHGQAGWLEALVSTMKAHADDEDVQWLGS